MNDDQLGNITKIGVSISSILTVSLIILNRVFYFGYFTSFGITAQVISVDMRDLLTPQLSIVSKFAAFLFGYMIVYEILNDRRKEREDIPKGSGVESIPELENKKPVYEKYVQIIIFLYFTIVLVVCAVTQTWKPIIFGSILNVLGVLFYFALKLSSIHDKWYSASFLISLVLVVTFVDGVLVGGNSSIYATIHTQNKEVIEDSQYIYANSVSYFIVKKGENKKLTCIPRSQVQEVLVYSK